MADKPGKDDVHEQRHQDQKAEGVVKGSGSGFQEPRRAPPLKPVPHEGHDGAKSDGQAPPRTPDHATKPD